MVAIPVLRSRVAPVLNWCSTIQIFPEEDSEIARGREIVLETLSGPERLKILKQQGVRTIICGALTPDLLSFGEGLGLRIIHGVAGEIGEVLLAYRTQSLDLPCFWLPGCGGLRRYRQQGGISCPRGGQAVPQEASRGGKAGKRPGARKKPSGGAGPGPAGVCICPSCGMKTPHERGIPCSQITCSRCHQRLTRA